MNILTECVKVPIFMRGFEIKNMNTCDNIELMKDIKKAKSLIACGSGIAGSAHRAQRKFHGRKEVFY
jgi:hypothetical protein